MGEQGSDRENGMDVPPMLKRSKAEITACSGWSFCWGEGEVAASLSSTDRFAADRELARTERDKDRNRRGHGRAGERASKERPGMRREVTRFWLYGS
jgi:hypothetical protein